MTAEHCCEPDGWPTKLAERWTCPECHRQYEPFRVQDMDHVPDYVRHLIPPASLGWRSEPVHD